MNCLYEMELLYSRWAEIKKTDTKKKKKNDGDSDDADGEERERTLEDMITSLQLPVLQWFCYKETNVFC